MDISDRLGKARNRIYKVGVELEGGWDVLPQGVPQLHGDSSVKFEPLDYVKFPPIMVKALQGHDIEGRPVYRNVKTKGGAPVHIGELPSPILLPEGKAGQPVLETWLRQHYPQHVNSTCGMHMHMSFRNAFQYQQLMDESYMWTVVEFVKRWADRKVAEKTLSKDNPLFDRLAGKSEYCQLKFDPDEQAQKIRKEFDHFGKGHRYTVINYAFSKTQTIECRLLPMMPTADLALEALRLLMDITSAFLLFIAKETEVKLDGRLAGKGEKGVSGSWAVEGRDRIEKEILQEFA